MEGSAPSEFGPFELRRSSRELFKHGKKLKLRPQPLQVLSLLLDTHHTPLATLFSNT
jgi:DNA-binding winged helix-turn-helix (wHTH) protein